MSWQYFLIAVRFLTRLPFPIAKDYTAEKVAQSAAFYPLVGLLLGALLCGIAWLTKNMNVEAGAFIILLAWVWLSGALHLDGFADTVDAWVGGLGDRERTLEIMKDSATGSMAVVALIILLLGKWVAIKALLSNDQIMYLLWLPVISRCLLAPFFIYSPYAKKRGMGVNIAKYIQRPFTWGVILFMLLASALHIGFAAAVLLSTASIAVFTLWRFIVIKRLNGVTGDTAGALVEMTELALLFLLI